VSIFGLS